MIRRRGEEELRPVSPEVEELLVAPVLILVEQSSPPPRRRPPLVVVGGCDAANIAGALENSAICEAINGAMLLFPS